MSYEQGTQGTVLCASVTRSYLSWPSRLVAVPVFAFREAAVRRIRLTRNLSPSFRFMWEHTVDIILLEYPPIEPGDHMGYEPPSKNTARIVSRVADIAELVGQLTIFDGLDPDPTLRRENQIRTRGDAHPPKPATLLRRPA